MGIGISRGRFLRALGGGALLALAGCGPSGQETGLGPLHTPKASPLRASKVWPLPGISPVQPEGVWEFRSRPDLSPAAAEITGEGSGTAPGYVFLALKEGVGEHGPMILDGRGRPVWFEKYTAARDFKMQRYRGRPVLTWWEGAVVSGHGVGDYVIFDDSYREISRVRPGNGFDGDLHEFFITPQDTALLTAYEAVPADLSAAGVAEDGVAWDGIVQELDIETGEVLFEWHSLDHVDVQESYVNPPEDLTFVFDYFHVNSIDVDHDDNLLISARNTSAIYKIDRESGEVIWRLGGKKSDFEMGKGTRTFWQHDARRHEDGTISIFDNGAHPRVHLQSRGIVVDLDEDSMEATMVREYTRPDGLVSTSQGNMQVLPNGNVVVGWGSEPAVSEFSRDGELLFDASFPTGCESYRAFRLPWKGRPTDTPALAIGRSSHDRVTLHASWNGATEVESWEVLSGPHPDRLEPLGAVPRDGFETVMLAQTRDPYLAVRATDDSGQILGTSVPRARSG
ncbi:MAG TPA: arylsulfotransferase family protein [Rubrobacter sp.]|nr:arylsulfotransferase family protein [Rubrobacter sp.]